jgi:hypothetical protein
LRDIGSFSAASPQAESRKMPYVVPPTVRVPLALKLLFMGLLEAVLSAAIVFAAVF